MFSCAEVVRKVASDEAVNADFWEKLRLRMHLAMCRHCSRFVRQLKEMKQAAKDVSTVIPEAEVADARARVVEGLLRK